MWCGLEGISLRLSLPGTGRTLYSAMLKYGNASIPFPSPILTVFSPSFCQSLIRELRTGAYRFFIAAGRCLSERVSCKKRRGE